LRRRAEHGDGLARLHEQRLVVPELEQRADDRLQRVVRARGAPGAAVDDELLRMLGDVAVEVVEQHAEGRFRRPRASVQRRAARRADRRQVARERLDELIGRDGNAHAMSFASSRAAAASRWSRCRRRTTLQRLAAAQTTAAITTAFSIEPPVIHASSTTSTAKKPYTSSESRYGCLDRGASGRPQLRWRGFSFVIRAPLRRNRRQ